MATHPSIHAWKIPRTEKLGGLQSIGSQRVQHDWSDLACMQAPSHLLQTPTHNRPINSKIMLAKPSSSSWHGGLQNFLLFTNLSQNILFRVYMLGCIQLFVTLWIEGPWGSAGKNAGEGCNFFLQRIFPTKDHASSLSPALADVFFTKELPGKPILSRDTFYNYSFIVYIVTGDLQKYNYIFHIKCPTGDAHIYHISSNKLQN